MRSLLPFFFFFFFALLLAAAPSSADGDRRNSATVGGWQPIENLSDPEVKKIASFAVAENNKKTNGVLKLSRVVSGETQVVSGLKYRLIIEAAAAGGGRPGKYEAVVWEQSWKKFRQLISFEKVRY